MREKEGNNRNPAITSGRVGHWNTHPPKTGGAGRNQMCPAFGDISIQTALAVLLKLNGTEWARGFSPRTETSASSSQAQIHRATEACL